MEPFLLHVAQLTAWLALLAVVFVPLERLCALHPAKLWRRDVGQDIALYFLNAIVPGLMLSLPLGVLAALAQRALPGALQDAVGQAPLAVRMIAALIVAEIGFYWGHRWTHEIPLLWRFHAVHHQPEHIDWLVNSRTHPIDMVFTRLCGLAPVYALGLGTPGTEGGLIPAAVVVLGTAWGFFIHANVRWRLGAFEHLVATPAFHHWHHVRTGPINTNYAAMLPWLDRVFGTHHLPKTWPDRYGIVEPPPR